jgi:hypothetical protein
MTLLIISTFLRDMKEKEDDFKGGIIYDCSAGSGISTLRMLIELEDGLVNNIVSNDESQNFPEFLNLMIEYNNIPQKKYVNRCSGIF